MFVKEGVIGWGHVRQMARREERGTASRMIPQYCGMREDGDGVPVAAMNGNGNLPYSPVCTLVFG